MADPLRESAVRAVVVTSGSASRAAGRPGRAGGRKGGHYLGRRVSKHTIESERRNAREKGGREKEDVREKRRNREKERKGKDAVTESEKEA